MINVQTVLKVADNSGAIFVKCIRLLNNSTSAKMGDCVTVVVKKNITKKNIKKSKEIKKGQICTGLIIRTKKSFKRWGNFFFKAGSNSIILVNKYFLPMGSRVIGPVFREIKSSSKFNKIASIAQITI